MTPKKQCKRCGTEFTYKNITAKFCSHKCRQAAYERRLKERRLENENSRRKSQQCSPLSNNIPKIKEKTLIRQISMNEEMLRQYMVVATMIGMYLAIELRKKFR